MVVDNGTAQTVAWTMPGPLMASISMMLAHARAPTPEHSMSLCGTLAQFKGIGEAEKQVVLIWESGHYPDASHTLPPAFSCALIRPDAGSVLRSRRDFIKSSPQSKLFLPSVGFQGFLGHCSFVCKQ
jgi:hypothetical protein